MGACGHATRSKHSQAMAAPAPSPAEPATEVHTANLPDGAVNPTKTPRTKRDGPYIVLVGLDLSEPGGRAWRFAFDLAELRGEETEIHAVVIGARGLSPVVKDVATPRASSAHKTDDVVHPPLKVLEHRSAGGEARLMAMHYRDGRPDRAIVRLAKEIGADLIVVASHPPSRIERLFGGSMADRIARSAPCPVVVVRPKRDADDPGVYELEPNR